MKATNMQKIGRPLKFTPEEMQERITEYFEYCSIDDYGYPLNKEHKPPTVTSLACYLRTTRDLLISYEDREGFSDTIKRAKQLIEAYNEAMLYSRSVSTTGVIFNLKNNWGWSDKAELETSFNGNNYEPVVVLLPDNGR